MTTEPPAAVPARTNLPDTHSDVVAARARLAELASKAEAIEAAIASGEERCRFFKSSAGITEAARHLLGGGKLPPDPEANLARLRHDQRIISHAVALAREQVHDTIVAVSRIVAAERQHELNALVAESYAAAAALTASLKAQRDFLRALRRGGLDLAAISWQVISPHVGPVAWATNNLADYHATIQRRTGRALDGTEYETAPPRTPSPEDE